MAAHYAAVLGRNPELSLAELYALAGSTVQPVSRQVAILTQMVPGPQRLGGILKLIKLAGIAPTAEQAVAALVQAVPTGSKVVFGISVFGQADAKPLALAAKAALRQAGCRARYIPSSGMLNSAQVKHNRLLRDGYEWCLIATPDGWHYGQTIWIPDFESFNRRDYAKPASDARRGMLPPQLSRILLNLADPSGQRAVYDPFCGVGGLLLEAASLGRRSYGSDIDPVAIAAAKRNADWLATDQPDSAPITLTVHDATTPLPTGEPVAIATEGYLGRPISAQTSAAEIRRQVAAVQPIMQDFLRAAADSLPTGQRISLTLPAWQVGGQTISLPVIAQLEQLGYTKVRLLPQQWHDFPLTERGTIMVARPRQRVIHELVVVERT